MRDDFAVFILTHGRANKVLTHKALRKYGYTGKIYFIIDDEDKQQDDYIKNFGKENVIVFSKKEASKNVDTCDNFDGRNMVIFARNTCFEIARKLKLKYFLELDDDYDNFAYRKEINGQLLHKPCKQMDKVCDLMIDFLEASGAKTVALAQAGDFIGGVGSNLWKKRVLRKVMNSFFCKVDNEFKFYGRINEDTTMYTYLGQKGELFFTIRDVMLNQMDTQQNAGGLTDIYLQLGTYVKSFYSVIYSPSCVRVATMGGGGNGHTYKRIHHRVNWNYCCPKIIDEKWKK